MKEKVRVVFYKDADKSLARRGRKQSNVSSRTRTTHQMQYQGFCSPEDGHNDARNMLRQKLVINIGT